MEPMRSMIYGEDGNLTDETKNFINREFIQKPPVLAVADDSFFSWVPSLDFAAVFRLQAEYDVLAADKPKFYTYSIPQETLEHGESVEIGLNDYIDFKLERIEKEKENQMVVNAAIVIGIAIAVFIVIGIIAESGLVIGLGALLACVYIFFTCVYEEHDIEHLKKPEIRAVKYFTQLLEEKVS